MIIFKIGTKVEIEVRGRSLTNKKLERIRMYFLLSMCSIHTNVPYESPILGQLLNLISLDRINLFEPRFEFYDPWDMAK